MKIDLALNKLQRFIRNKTQPTKQSTKFGSIWPIDRTLSCATAMQGYTAFLKAPELLDFHDQIV